MQPEVHSKDITTEQVQNQMDLLERKISDMVTMVSRLRNERGELVGERDALVERLREYEEKLGGADNEALKSKLDALRDENDLLRNERESIARRVGELLDKLDLLST